MAQRGRPKKKDAAETLEDVLNIAQKEIDKVLPKEIQNALVPIEPLDIPATVIPKISRDAQDDYDFARSNITGLLKKGNDLLTGITDLARDSDHPRTYEVASNLVKILIEGNRELLALQKDIREVEKKSGSQETTQPLTIENAETVNHIIFEGTSMEMLDVVEALREKKKLEQSKVN